MGLLAVSVCALIPLGATRSSYSSTLNRNQTIGTPPLVKVGLSTAKSSAPQQYVVSGISPGATTDQLVNLQNDGTASTPDLEISVTTSTSTSLDTDATNGLYVAIDKCSGPWQQLGASAAATCNGTTTSILASTPLATMNSASAPTPVSSGVSSLSTAGIDHLRVRFSLPSGASPSYASLTSNPTVTLWGAGPPSAPTSLAPGDGDGQAVVTWGVPAGTYSLPVTGYTATLTPGPTVCTTTSALTCTFTGLTDGTVYSVSVTATNSLGTGTAATTPVIAYPASLLTSSSNFLWLDGADSTTEFQDTAGTTPVTAASQPIALWKDKSGQHEDVSAPGAVPGTVPTADTTTFAGKTVPVFSSGRYLSRASAFPSGSDYTIFAVYRSTSNCTGNILSGSSARAFYLNSGNGATIYHGGSTVTTGTGGTANTAFIATDTFVNSTKAATVDVNAQNPATGTLSNTYTDTGVQIGAYTGSSGFCGQIAETGAFNRVLTAAERRTMEEYLGRKWNVVIAPTAPPGVTVLPGATTAAVSWTAPSYNGGGTITGYTATTTPGGASCTTTGATSCTITGLGNGTTYTVTVTATNSGGTSLPATASFVDGGAPTPPQAVATSPVSGGLTLGWNAPASDGGSAITGYTATASPGGATCTTTGATSCTISGLTNGTTYTVTVTATNANGTSAASSSASGVAGGSPTAPGTPASLTLTAGDTTLAASWSAPAVNGGASITGYTVTASPGGFTCSTTSATTCTLTGLTNGTGYSVTVTATNSAGTGPASTAVTGYPYPASLLTSSSNVLWLDGADASTEFQNTAGTTLTQASGQNIADWKDKSGNHNDVTAPSSAPTADNSTWSGKTVPTFSASHYLTKSSGFPTGSDYSIFAVYRPTTSCTGNIFSGTSNRALYTNGTTGLTIFHNSSVLADTGQGAAINNSYIGSDTFVNSSMAATVDVNGLNPVTGTLSNATTDAGLTVGALNGGNGFCGTIAEIAVFNRLVTATERRTIEEYLSRKWNVKVTAGSPTSPTATVASTTSITAGWAAPAYNGGASVTTYTATASPGGATCSGSGTSCTITGLTHGTAYTVTVTATNSVGVGQPSAASTSATP